MTKLYECELGLVSFHCNTAATAATATTAAAATTCQYVADGWLPTGWSSYDRFSSDYRDSTRRRPADALTGGELADR